MRIEISHWEHRVNVQVKQRNAALSQEMLNNDVTISGTVSIGQTTEPPLQIAILPSPH